jgi:hypothetical protein
MAGGNISNNKNSSVQLSTGGTFNMAGGSITGNTSSFLAVVCVLLVLATVFLP